MLPDRVQRALNQQINAEISSAYLYLSMSAYFASANLPGLARWMRVQRQEELSHAMKLFDFVNDRGGRVRLQSVNQPPTEFQSPLDVFEQTLRHEREVTAKIHELYALAVEEHDYATQVMLHWFIDEQVEEEKVAVEVVEHLRLIGDQRHALLTLDARMGERSAEK